MNNGIARILLSAIFLLLAVPGLAAADTTLSGTVYALGRPLAGATVTLADTGSLRILDTATTDGAGRYRFAPAPGSYDLTVVAGGFAGWQGTGIGVADRDVVQDVQLALAQQVADAAPADSPAPVALVSAIASPAGTEYVAAAITAPPTGSVSIDGGAPSTNSTLVTLALTCSDDLGNPCAEMRFSNDDLTWSAWEPYSAGKNWQIPAVEGSRTVYVQYRDGAGSASASVTDDILLDSTLVLESTVLDALQDPVTERLYPFSLPADGQVTIDFNHWALATNKGWTIYLLDPSGNEYLNFTSMGTTLDMSRVIGLPAGNYRVKVVEYAYVTSEPYYLTVHAVAGSGYEKEFNDTLATANPLALGTTLQGALQYKGLPSTLVRDIDWYQVTLDQAGLLSLDFQHAETFPNGNFDWHIYLFDALGNEYLNFTAGFGAAAVTREVGLPAGTYYVQVREEASDFRMYTYPYQLGARFTAGSNYEQELNDTQATATPLSPGTTLEGVLQYKGSPAIPVRDIDWYQVTLDQAGLLSLDFQHAETFPDGNFDWHIYLFDASGNEYLHFSAGFGALAVTREVGLPAGTYYVQVREEASDFRIYTYPYQLGARFTAGSTYEQELNDSQETANPVASGTTYQANLQYKGPPAIPVRDVDWFRFEVAAESNYRLRFSHEDLGSSVPQWRITLFDGSSSELASIVSSGLQPQVDQVVRLSPGSYTIEVGNENAADNYGYGLLVQDLTGLAYWPDPTPTGYGSRYQGVCTVDGVAAQPEDEVAAFDPQGILCGHFMVTSSGLYGVMDIYGDDPATTDVDEGAVAGDRLTFKVWDHTTGRELSGRTTVQDGGPDPVTWADDAGSTTHQVDINGLFEVTVNIDLQPGWNLVSFPLGVDWYTTSAPPAVEMPTGTEHRSVAVLGDLLASIDGAYESVFAFQNGSWTFYNPAYPAFSTLKCLAGGYGYWIKMTQSGTLTLTGPPLDPAATLQLASGWNLVGYWGADAMNMPGALGALSSSANFTSIFGFDPVSGWQFYNRALGFGTLPALNQGKGYWIQLTAPELLDGNAGAPPPGGGGDPNAGGGVPSI